jgi:tellurite resistance protein TerC
METIGLWWMWAGFAVFVVLATLVDLLAVRSEGAHKVSFREALGWSAVWITLAMVFNALLWWYLDVNAGRALANQKATEFFTGYLIEKSLAVDNIFVFLLIFTFFKIPVEFQKRVLILGVVGAIVLRVVMILVGAWLIARFHWILYLFGAFLLITGIKMAWFADHQPDLDKNPILKFMRHHMKISHTLDDEKFYTTQNGVRYATPLLLVLVMIAVTDVIFAVDSIPAIFAITRDPFIVMTSNIFAILGLRAMYFMLAGAAERFHLLSYGLAGILMFIGTKMLIVDFYKIPVGISLGVVIGTLVVTMVASVLIAPKEKAVDSIT